jgi:hypothetical protein
MSSCRGDKSDGRLTLKNETELLSLVDEAIE